METSFKERVKYFQDILLLDDDDPVIDLKRFREACFHGIPDEGGCHATAWKVLLGYLPPDKRLWESTLHDKRLSYYSLVRDLLQTPSEKPASDNDHPLNATPGSTWASYIQDNATLEQIDKDVRRTLPDFAFFQQQVPHNILNPLSALPDDLPLVSDNDLEPSVMKRRLSFGFMGRPRSGSNASRKSVKQEGNRSRSNSRSSTRSYSSTTAPTNSSKELSSSPRNIVRKLSSALSLSSSSLSLDAKFAKYNTSNKPPAPICPPIPHRRSFFKRIPTHDDENAPRQDGGTPDIDSDTDDAHVQDYHWEVIERLLFMYAKLNPGVGYVQGMNELLAPIYYLFANDHQMAKQQPSHLHHPQFHHQSAFVLASQAHAEADTFFVFSALMADVRDHFVRSLDQDGLGIHATMLRLQQRLAWYDRPLWHDLQRKQVKEPYYAFRWITVLFTQEWDLPDVIRLWDALLAERSPEQDTPFEFMLDFAVAMLVCVRQPLLEGDFATNVKLLQNYPTNDIQLVLQMATRIRNQRLQAQSLGQAIPGVNDVRHSGMFAGDVDWSDTASIASTASNASSRLQQRLRESTDMARASFDSFRKDSRESMDEFRRSLSRRSIQSNASSTQSVANGVGADMKRSISQRFGLVKNSVLSKTTIRRTSSIHSNHTLDNGYDSIGSSQHPPRSWRADDTHGNSMQRSQSARSYLDPLPTSHASHTTNPSRENLYTRLSNLMVNTTPTPTHHDGLARSAAPHARASSDDSCLDNEKLVFAKAAAARDQVLQYRS
ncbi:RabGAP/TBC [Hesseltinella vesiculosa]|uniref:RabGAP/TBC n=1 Tax=Hesseltinella vesiculosa TaxID=101127 RepID=A0A1X2GIP5_9FUNG|nr:RabGAP/TBC [Hesseltinella vesiculosa]